MAQKAIEKRIISRLPGLVPLCLFGILLVAAGQALSQGSVVFDYPSPRAQISGLASDFTHMWVLDPQAGEILGLDFLLGSVEVVMPCGVANPTRLACADSVLYFAESGTAILHAFSVEGEPLGQFDLSSLGIGEITGIGSENASPYNDFLWIADSTQKVCFKIGPLLDFSQCLAEVDISTAPIVSDLTNGFDQASVSCWLCFGDGNPQVQLWEAAYGLVWSRDFSYCGIEGISLVTEYNWGYSGEFLCVYDPSSSTIYGIYFGMGLEQGTWGSIKSLF